MVAIASPAAVLSIIVEANTGKAEAALKEFQRNLSKADREKAEAELAFQVEKGGYNVFSGLVKKADSMSAEASLGFEVDNASLVKAKAAQAVLTKESSKLSDVFSRSQLSIGQWTGILAASLPVVFDLAGALGALTASLGAATAGLGALGVGIGGVLSVGFGGIAAIAAPAIGSLTDLMTAQESANKAQTTGAASAARAAASSAQQISAAHDQVISAEQQLEQAQASAEIAQESLTQAREDAVRQLLDMRRASVEGATSEKRAQISLRQARADLLKLQRDGSASALDLESAELSVVEARQALRDATISGNRAQKDFNEAQRGGISQMDGVVSAQQSLDSAMQGVEDAHKGVADAVENLANQQKEANAAAGAGATSLAALALAQKKAGPAAVKFAHHLKEMTKEWRRLTAAGREDFFGMLDDGLTRLNRKLPMFADSAEESVRALREAFNRFLDRATGPEFNHFIEVMTNTFAKSVKPLAGAFGNIAKVLQRIAVAVAPDIVRMARGFEDMTEGWVDSTRNAGKLRDTIHALVNQANAWWKLIKATGELIVSVLVPGMGQGKRAVEGITASIKGWTDWVRGHPQEMQNFFAEGLETTKQLAAALLSFLPTIVEISKAMRPIARLFLGLVKALNSINIGSVSALTVLLGGLVAGKAVKGVVGMASAFGRLKTAILGTAVAETALGAATTKTTTAMATQQVAATAGGAMTFGSGPQRAVKGAGAMAPIPQGPIVTPKVTGIASLAKYAKVAGGVAVAVTALVGAFEALRTNFLGVRDVFTGFFEKALKPLGDAFTDLIDELTGGHADDVFRGIGAALTTIAKPIKFVVTNMTKLVGLLAIGGVSAGFVVAITAIAGPIWLAIKAITTLVKGIKWLLGRLKDVVQFIAKGRWDKLAGLLAAPFRIAWDVVKKIMGFIKDRIGNVVGFVKDRWGNLKGILTAPFRAVSRFVADRIGDVIAKVRDAIDFIRDRWPEIKRILTAPFRAIKNAAKGVFDWLKDRIESLIDKVQGLVDKIKSIKDIPGDVAGGVVGAAQKVIPGVQKGGLVTAQGIVPLPGYARGGIVGARGPQAGPQDKIPALLALGEMVIPKKMVEETKKNAKLTAGAMTGELGKGQKEVAKDTDKFAKDHGSTWEKVKDQVKKVTARIKKGTTDDFQRTHKDTEKMMGRLRKGTLDEFEKTSKGAERDTDRMRDRVNDGFGKMRSSSVDQSGKMKQGVAGNFGNMTRAVGDGLGRIAKMTNNSLKALGVKKVDFHVAEGKQRGGPIGGAGVGDKVPAMLEPGEFVVNKVATKKHRAALEQLNFKDAPRFQKGGGVDKGGGMQAMIAEANKFERRHFPYAWGGGHGGFGIQPVDCSGAVSDVLHAAGLLNTPLTSGALMNWGKPGKGPLTVYTNPHHVVMSLNGKVFGTSGSNPGGGAGWIEGASGESLAPGAVRTMDVKGGALAKQVKRLVMKGPKGPLKDMGQATLDKVRGAANRLIQKKQPSGGGQTLNEGAYKGKLDKVFPHPGGPSISFNQAAMLAEKAGLPGITYAQIAQGESGLRPGAVSPDGGYGLWQMTPRVQSAATVAAWHNIGSYFNPWHNALMAKYLAGSGTGVSNYFGTGFVTDANKHYTGKIKMAQGGVVAPYVGSFDKGGEVAQTGLGMLHKGEHVVALRKGGAVPSDLPRPTGDPFADLRPGGKIKRGLGLNQIETVRDRLGKQVNKILPKLDEGVDIASQIAGATSSPGGSELTKGELTKQITIQRKLLSALKKTLQIAERGMKLIDRAIKRIHDQVKKLQRKIDHETKRMERQVERFTDRIEKERKRDDPDQKKIEKYQAQIRDIKERSARPLGRWQEDLDKRTQALKSLPGMGGGFRQQVVEMTGLTGRGGRIFDAKLALDELKALGKPQPLHIGELLEFAEAMRFGAFRRAAGPDSPAAPLPTFHQGGIVPGLRGQEVQVLARGGEVFQAPGQGAPVVNLEVVLSGGLEALNPHIDVRIREKDRDSRRVHRAGRRP